MKRYVFVVLLACLVSHPVLADVFAPVAEQASHACRRAIMAAERAYSIPTHLLAAIAHVESGRRDPGGDRINPWPWTINMDGQGSFYDTKIQAVTTARAMRPRVVHSIDVGCMQISLTQHPDAFASLEQAFEPATNADYGARFLQQLYARTNSWPKAVAMYHSATPDLGEEYRLKVYAALPLEQRVAEEEPSGGLASPSLMGTPMRVSPLQAAWSASINQVHFSAGGLRPTIGRLIPLQAGPGGTVPPGRSLDAYRATPVLAAFRSPVRRW